MKLQIERHDDRSVIFLNKNVMIGSDAAVLQNAVLDLIQEGSKSIEVDLSGLDYITSWGIGSLFHALKTCQKSNVDFSLTAVNKKIYEILENVDLLKVFKIKAKEAPL